MIVPRNRLLVWVAVLGLSLGLLLAAEPASGPLCLAGFGVLIGVAAVDALGARKAFGGLHVELPAVTRMSKDRAAMLEVRVHNPSSKASSLRFALALPREIDSPQEEAEVKLPEDAEWSRFSWPCLPRQRGSYRIDTIWAEATSPLGLWAARRPLPARSEIRVYPNLGLERRNLAALFMNRGVFGMHAQRQVGKGREFEKLREYVPGDSFDEIHWKATARRGRPITKVFQIERTQEIYVVLDASRLSARAAGGTQDGDPAATVLERFITASLVLGLAAEQQGDLFGLLAFSDQVNQFLRAKNGKAHYSSCRDALYTLQSRIVTPDYDEVCSFIRLRLRRRALLIFLTSLDDPVAAEALVRNLDLIRRQHLVMVNMIQPPGVSPVFSNPNVASLDDLYRHLGGHLLWHKLREWEKVLQRRGVRFSLLPNERLSVELVSQYLNVKRRQML